MTARMKLSRSLPCLLACLVLASCSSTVSSRALTSEYEAPLDGAPHNPVTQGSAHISEGYAAYVARLAGDRYFVQFSSDKEHHLWGSEWPEWAAEVAHDALLHNKRLNVSWQGDGAFGRNLIWVSLQKDALKK